MELFKSPLAFEWDSGNKDKNLAKHGVTNEECEEVFFDPHKRILGEAADAGTEKRYLLVGRTTEGKGLFIFFAILGNKIRVVSARNLNREERRFLE